MAAVIGADGRRVVRHVADAYARELCARIEAETGEVCTVVDEGLVASGVAHTEPELAADGIDEEPEAKPAPRPRRRRTP